MKVKKTIITFLCVILLFIKGLFAQEQKDSINYYVELYSKAKNSDDLVKAYFFFEKEKESSLDKKHYLGVAYSLLYISSIQSQLGQYFDSENSAIESLEYLDNLPEDNLTVFYRNYLSNRLGNIMMEFKKYKKAIKYYSDVIKYTSKTSDSIIAYNNIGVAYKNLNELDKAKSILLKAYELAKTSNDSGKISLTLSNLGYVKAISGEEDGISNMSKALEIRLKTNDYRLYETYKDFTDYFLFKKDTVKALVYTEKGYRSAKKVNNLPYQEKALNSLIKLGQIQYALEYSNVVEKVKENNNSLRNTYATVRYNVNREQEKFRNILSNKRKENIILYFSGTFILLGSIFLYFFLKTRHKKEKLKKQFETEQRISKKLHDEVANDVYSMMSRLQNNPTTEKELIDNLEDVYLKTRDISKTNAALEVSQNFDELLKDLITSYKTTGVNIFTRNLSKVSWDSLSDLKKETLYRVIQELMTNMRKHSKASLVTLKFEEKKHRIYVFYIDDGIGCELKHGNGLRNTENRMELAGGSITFESEANKGFQAKITI